MTGFHWLNNIARDIAKEQDEMSSKDLAFVMRKINKIVTHRELVTVRNKILLAYNLQFDGKPLRQKTFVETGTIAEYILERLTTIPIEYFLNILPEDLLKEVRIANDS